MPAAVWAHQTPSGTAAWTRHGSAEGRDRFQLVVHYFLADQEVDVVTSNGEKVTSQQNAGEIVVPAAA